MSDQSLAQRSPRSRKSLSTGISFGNQENQALLPSLSAGKKGKGRAASIGGVELMGARAKPLLSPKKAARRAAAPRKSILKQYNQDDTTQFGVSADQDDDEGDTQFLSAGGESTTMRFRRRVSFAAHAHVRMFETEPASNQLSQSHSSASSRQQAQQAALPKATATANIFGGPPPVVEASAPPSATRRRSSAGGHSRRASVQGVDAFSKPAPAVGFVPTPSINSRRSSAASEGSVDMDIESDEDDRQDGQYNFQLDPPTPGPGSPPSVFEGSASTPFQFGNPNPPAIVIQQDEDDEGDATDDGDMSLEAMDETQVHGGILSGPPAAKRQSLTHPTSPSASTDPGDSDEDDGELSIDQEDKTMDFTVATGGIIPTSAPATASYVRGSVGYAIEQAEAERMAAWSKIPAPEVGSLAARRAAAAAEEEMRWDAEEGEDDDGSEMDFTRVIGGIIKQSDDDAEGEDGSTMDFTRATGGIIAPDDDEEDMDEESDLSGEMDMDETVAVGGLISQRNHDEDQTTRRTIFDNDDTAAMDFTVAHGGLLAAPAQPQQPIASPQRPLFGRSSLNSSSTSKSPAKSPRKSLGAFVPPTPTRPLESSLTRPTASSAAKIKPAPTPRTASIFDSPAKPLAPIPSRGKPSAATPGSARKLSFGAVASPGKKRAAEEMEEGSASIFSVASTAKSPKRRASAANSVQAQPVEVDVFGAVAGSGGARGKGRETAVDAPAPAASTSNIFGTYVVEENIFTAPEQPPSPKKAPSATAPPPPPGSPVRSIFSKATSPSPSKRPATIFDIPSSSPALASESAQFEQATSIFSTSPKVAPPPAAVHRPRSSLAFAEPMVPAVASSSSSPSKNVSQAAITTMEEKSFSKAATPKKKLGRPSISRRERDSVEEEAMVDEAHQPAPIALGQFLDMTGLTFMDKIHPRRRSTIGPGEMLGIHRNQGDSTTRSMAGREYQTIEYANYVLSFPYLAIYQWACSHLKESTIQSQQTVQVLDHNASSTNPLLFREYLEAEDEEKGMIEAQLKYLKVYSHLLIKRRWREWRLDLIVKLKSTHETDLADLEEDRTKIQALTIALEQQTPLSKLRARHAEVKAQLERERAKVEEVLACDQGELAHRRNEYKEQNDQIDSLKADLADHTVMLHSLTTKRDALDAQRAAAQEAIDRASSSYADTQGFTREKLYRLKDEFETISHLHGMAIISLRADEMSLVFHDTLRLVLPCTKFAPKAEGARIEFVSPAPGTKARRNEPILERLAGLVATFLASGGLNTSKSVNHLVSTVAHLSASIQAVSTELHLVALRYPLTLLPVVAEDTSLGITVPLLLPAKKARVLLTYTLTAQTLLGFPASLAGVECHVAKGYGKVDPSAVEKVVKDRLAGAGGDGAWFGTLVEGCLAGVEPFQV